jgi:hypothetical protein
MNKIKKFCADHKEAIVTSGVAVTITAVAVTVVLTNKYKVTEINRCSFDGMPEDKQLIQVKRGDGKSQFSLLGKPE